MKIQYTVYNVQCTVYSMQYKVSVDRRSSLSLSSLSFDKVVKARFKIQRKSQCTYKVCSIPKGVAIFTTCFFVRLLAT